MHALWSGSLRASRGPALGALAIVLGACDAATPLGPRESQLRPADPSRAAAKVTIGKLLISADSGVDRKTWSVTTGTKAYFSILAFDKSGKRIPNASAPVAKYKSSKVNVFAIDSLTGVGEAKIAGNFQVTVTAGGISTTVGLNAVVAPTTAPAPTTTTTPPPPTTTSTTTTTTTTTTTNTTTTQAPPPPPPPPPVTTSSFNLAVVRFDNASGAATVSSGIPLRAGALRPGGSAAVRVTVGGVEQPIHVAELPSLHADGSLRSVLVQFRLASLPSTGTTGRLDIATSPRPTAMTLANPIVTPGAVVSGTPAGLPQAAALPSDPSYLVATDVVGSTKTVAAATAIGGSVSRYESDFVTNANRHWSIEGAAWSGNYYDRALIYYAFWARTGNAQYWARAGQIAYDYRTKYLEANAYGSSPHWAQLEGLEKHFLLTGDDASRQAVGRTAGRLYGAFNKTAYLTRVNGESRIAARLLHAQLLSWRLSTATTALAGVSQATWGTQVESIFDQIAAWQQPDGSFPADGQICGGQLNYMVGLQNDALIKVFEQYVPATTSRATLQTRARTIVTKAIDHLWATQWLPTNRAFKYASVDCSSKNVGGPSPAPDLNNLISPSVAWAYAQTRNIAYLAQADQIFAGGVTQAFLAGTKQFNENYTASFRYLGYR